MSVKDPYRFNHSIMAERSALNTHTIEHRLLFKGGHVEVRNYEWDNATVDTWRVSDSYFFDCSLVTTPRPAQASYTLNGERISSENIGRIFVVPPGYEITSESDRGTHHSLHCTIASSIIDNLLPGKPVWTENKLRKGLRLSDPGIERLFSEIYCETRRSAWGGQTKVESLTTILAVELIRYLDLEYAPLPPVSGGLAPWRMKLIRERVNSEGALPSLSELSQLCGVSIRHLSRGFKKETGQTLGKYIESAMIERASVMLSDKNMSVADVAMLMGFSSPSGFAFAFRRATGTRPRDIARSHLIGMSQQYSTGVRDERLYPS